MPIQGTLVDFASFATCRAGAPPDDYVTALEAHRDRALVELWAVLHRGTRVYRITSVSGFGRVDR